MGCIGEGEYSGDKWEEMGGGFFIDADECDLGVSKIESSSVYI